MAQRDLVGKLIGKYRITKAIGRGGMGTVYEAIHTDLNQRVAVKVLNSEHCRDPQFVRRFFDEARAVTTVNHPGLVRLFDFNSLDGSSGEEGTLYLMMEFLEGDTLRERLKKLATQNQAFVPRDALRIVRQIASALSAVHTKGIIHRDLKPENVMLVLDPDTPGGQRTKILDFGIAKFGEHPDGRMQTTASILLGTPTYMSPEQCDGQPLTERSDVYALGVVFYELLTGEPPFVSESSAGVMRQHLAKDPPRLPASIPVAYDQLFQRMLHKDAPERPTMAEVMAEIDRIEEGRATTEGVLPSKGGRGFGKRRVVLVAGGLLLFGIVGLAIGWSSLDWFRPTPKAKTIVEVPKDPPPALAPTKPEAKPEAKPEVKPEANPEDRIATPAKTPPVQKPRQGASRGLRFADKAKKSN